MARVTVEDCVEVVSNRYELVLLAAQRARDIAAGSQITVNRDNDKNPVIALREIAGQSINLLEVKDHIVNGVNRMGDLNEEDDLLLALAGQGPAIEEAGGVAVAAAIEEVAFDAGASAVSAAEEEVGDEFDGLTDGERDFDGGMPEGFQEEFSPTDDTFTPSES